MSKKTKSQQKKPTKKTLPRRSRSPLLPQPAPVVPDARLPPAWHPAPEARPPPRRSVRVHHRGGRDPLRRPDLPLALGCGDGGSEGPGAREQDPERVCVLGVEQALAHAKDPPRRAVRGAYHGQVETIVKGATDESRTQIAAAIGSHAKPSRACSGASLEQGGEGAGASASAP